MIRLALKYIFQFGRQARLGGVFAQRFYAGASARMACYAIDLGDPGSNLRDVQRHLECAQRQTLAKLREAIEQKVRKLMAGVSRR